MVVKRAFLQYASVTVCAEGRQEKNRTKKRQTSCWWGLQERQSAVDPRTYKPTGTN